MAAPSYTSASFEIPAGLVKARAASNTSFQGLTEESAFSLPVLPRLVGSSRVDLQACKLEYSIVSPK